MNQKDCNGAETKRERSFTLGNGAGARTALWFALASALIPIICLAIPMYVIRPFRPQDSSQLAFALTVRDLAPSLSVVCVVVVLLLSIWAWRRTSGFLLRIAFATLSIVAVTGACLTHVNIFEVMFHPYDTPAFGDLASAQLEPNDKVLAVRIGTEAHAYPILAMGYHHIVNDTVDQVPIAVTYCTLCHTGLVWNRTLDGRTLYFRLAGINNGNALMRDTETSSIWQQSTGQAIFGPLKGRQLGLIHSDELTFALWRKEQPAGIVLKPDAKYAAKYEDRDWEKEAEKTRTVVDTRQSGIAPHELMLGITSNGHSKAYPVKAILSAKLIQDQIAGDPILLVVGPDNASIRAFKGNLAESPMTFFPVLETVQVNENSTMRDAETQSIWNFEGCAISGKLSGKCLIPVDANKDYWFDWMNHHSSTAVFGK